MNALFTNYTHDEIQLLLIKSKNDADEMIRDIGRLCDAANKDHENVSLVNAAHQLIMELYNEFDFQLYILHQLDYPEAKQSIDSIIDAKNQVQQRSGIKYPTGKISIAGV